MCQLFSFPQIWFNYLNIKAEVTKEIESSILLHWHVVLYKLWPWSKCVKRLRYSSTWLTNDIPDDKGYWVNTK